MNKLLCVMAIVTAAILLTSTIATQEVLAKSKTHNKVDKFLRKNTSGGDKMTDLCKVTIDIEDKKNISLIVKQKDCEAIIEPPVGNDTQPPVVNDTQPPQTCGENEVWSEEDKACTCKEGFENNTESCVPVPPQPVCPTGQFYNTTSKECQVIVIPEPEPVPTNATVKIIGVGDVECSGDGAKVLSQIKKQNPTLVLNLGDLCYDSTINNYLSTWGGLGNLLACQIGNHDAEEDGSPTLYKAFLKYCGNDYTVRDGGVLSIGLNTNDDTAGLNSQSQGAVKRLSNATFMQGVKVVIVASHKPICLTPPNSHHPVDEDSKAKAVKAAFCEPIKAAVPDNVLLVFLSGHNHVMSSGEQNGIKYVQSGAGGAGHYTCGTDAVIKFCNNKVFGFWELTLEPTGQTTTQFKDVNGGVIN